MATLDTNTSITDRAVGFLRLASSGRVREAYDTYAGPTFKHHNPYFAAGADALRAGMEEAHEKQPNLAFEVQRTIADGNFVWVHSRVRKASGDIAVVHIFRFDNGQIAELWDVGAALPADSPNQDGPF
jgi:predicted SnoaL-like aldol condensation-catalyzing enzyme